MSTPIRLGIIGCGFIVERRHVPALRGAGSERVIVTAVADIDQEAAGRIASQFEAAERFSSYEELLERGTVDAVDICLPHHLHADAVAAAARAGKHILCEKPLCRTLEEAELVNKEITSNGITFMCAHNRLFMPSVQRATELRSQGALGKLHDLRVCESSLNVQAVGSFGWRGNAGLCGGGELIDSGWHAMYLLLHLAGSPPREVVAMLDKYRVVGMEGEDSAQLLVRFESGAVGSVETSWAHQPAGCTERFSLVGAEGSLWGDASRLSWRKHREETQVEVLPEVDMFEAEVDHFLSALSSGSRPIATQAEGTSVLQVVLAAYRSAVERRVVALDELNPVTVGHHDPERPSRGHPFSPSAPRR